MALAGGRVEGAAGPNARAAPHTTRTAVLSPRYKPRSIACAEVPAHRPATKSADAKPNLYKITTGMFTSLKSGKETTERETYPK